MELFDYDSTTFNREDLDRLLAWSHNKGASDIFIEIDDYIYVDIHGTTLPVSNVRLRADEVSGLLRSIYQDSGPDYLRTKNDIKFRYTIMLEDDSLINFRVTATGTMAETDDGGIEIQFRPFQEVAPSLEELGIPMSHIDAINSKFGLALITGPTGSGKSTSIASMLSHTIRTRKERVVTFEDPVEFDFKKIKERQSKVSQTEINTHLNSYAQGVANVLRRTPKKVFFSEARDKQTVSDLITVALTGHMVMSTIHTNSTEMTITRLIDLFPAEEQRAIATRVIDSLRLIVHQRLVMTPDERGRTAIRSSLVFSEEIRRKLLLQVNELSNLPTIMYKLVAEHGQTLISDLKEKFLNGRVHINEYLSIVMELGHEDEISEIPHLLDIMVKNKKISLDQRKLWAV